MYKLKNAEIDFKKSKKLNVLTIINYIDIKCLILFNNPNIIFFFFVILCCTETGNNDTGYEEWGNDIFKKFRKRNLEKT